MSINDRLRALAAKVPNVRDRLDTEEATKNALVMPFIAALGYDVFDPLDVVPEYVADVGTKRGEKVDYAVCKDGEIVMIFEAKSVASDLNDMHASQLFRYFTVTKARIGVLTNGVEYRFYSDLEEPNKMDERPFLVLELDNLREEHLPEVSKLGKNDFDLQSMLSSASDLKDLSAIRSTLERQFVEPEEPLVKWLFSNANPNGRFGSSAKIRFSTLVLTALNQVVRDRVNARLRSALQDGEDVSPRASQVPPEAPPAAVIGPSAETAPEGPADAARDRGIVTTKEELRAYDIVRAIGCGTVDWDRIVGRDTQSYFGVLLDDNNRKPICRFMFNSASKKYLVLFDADKKPVKHAIEHVEDIYLFADQIRAGAARFDHREKDSTVAGVSLVSV